MMEGNLFYDGEQDELHLVSGGRSAWSGKLLVEAAKAMAQMGMIAAEFTDSFRVVTASVRTWPDWAVLPLLEWPWPQRSTTVVDWDRDRLLTHSQEYWPTGRS
jgi:hypothetical protein